MFITYDEQVLWVNNNIKLRMTYIRCNKQLNNPCMNTVDGEKFDKHTIKEFLNDSF